MIEVIVIVVVVVIVVVGVMVVVIEVVIVVAQFEPCFLGSTISIFKGGSEYNFYLKVEIKISSKVGYQRGGNEN